MKALLRLLIILAVSLAGEILASLIPLPIPASIYGMVLMFIALACKIVPLDSVRDSGKFLVEIMPVMFIPSAVGLIVSWDALKSMLLPCLIAMIPSTLLIMAASGWTTQALLRGSERRRKDESHHC